jgi:TrpR-related protein YerC/YecD
VLKFSSGHLTSQRPRSKLAGHQACSAASCEVFDPRGGRQMEIQVFPFGLLRAGIKEIGNMSKKIRTEAVDYLFSAVLSLKNKEECYTFFEDICTINELLSLSQRFEVARMLREQKTYLEIADKTGASTATISRVNRSLNYGNDGYDMVFERLGKNEKKDA